MKIPKFLKPKPKESQSKFSEFFHNASKEERERVFLEVTRRANNEQHELLKSQGMIN